MWRSLFEQSRGSEIYGGIGVGRTGMPIIAGDVGVCAVIVNGLEVLGADRKPGDVFIGIELLGDIAHHIFHEFGIGEALFRYVLFIHPLEDGIDITGRGFLYDLHHILNPDKLLEPGSQANLTPLIVRPHFTDLFGAWTDGRNGHVNLQHEIHVSVRIGMAS